MAASHASMHGKVCLITGATSGIGRVSAQSLAQYGATVVLVGRSAERGAAAVAEITRATGNHDVHFLPADLSYQADIRHLATTFQSQFERLDVLVNNAGAIFSRRQLSANGIEMTLALNHLGYFLLTHLLLDILKASAPARIINVASRAHISARLDLGDLQGQRRYGGWRAYCQSKLANIMFTYDLASRLHRSKVTVNTLHPGFVATRFGHNNAGAFASMIRLLQLGALKPKEGADTMIYLATAPEIEGVTGEYFFKRQALRSSKASYDKTAARQLWEISTGLVELM